MTDFELKNLAETWCRLYQGKSSIQEREADFWSFEVLSSLCRDNPDLAWKVIVQIYANRPDETVLSNLATGPLEDLFVYQGDLALPWVDKYCANEANFVKVLQMVWRNAMSDDVWNGLKRTVERYT
ncbi:DUF6869 domain-containing protein [Massilia sp. 9096]|uniref:DUF6869 domain-containing protein n=1 Tax=Massilia sp. 9096 TaxID=1500894 RepID=UPI0005612B6C|nr:hypothetical protein [Massilia sp. 9096]